MEAKGGSGQLGTAYGYRQGTTEWAVQSARRVVRSSKAGAAEKDAAKAVLEAAIKGKLEVQVIRTDHVFGEPIAAVLEQNLATSEEATRLARAALDELAAAVLTDATVEGAAGANAGVRKLATEGTEAVAAAADGTLVATASVGGKLLHGALKVALPAAVLVDGGLLVNEAVATERDFAAGKITERQRETAHAKNCGGFVGGWGGALGGAEIGASGGAIVGGPIGAAIGGVIGAIGGYLGGEKAGEAVGEGAVNLIHGS